MVDLTLEAPGDHHFVRAISEQGIRIGDTTYRRALVVTATQLISDWNPQDMTQLTVADLEAIIALEPEVVLLGTGARQQFLEARDMYRFYEHGIGIEVMDTEAACRTFNVLVTEGRNVAAALMPFN